MWQLTLILLLSCLAVFSYAENKPEYEIAIVEEQVIPIYYPAPGYTAALNKIEISSRQTGFIKQVLVEEGDIVEQDQLLLVLDETVHLQNIEQVTKAVEIAQITVIDAEKDVKNFVRLSKVQSISEEKLRKARLLLAHAQKTLLQARAKLNETAAAFPYLRLKSPLKAQVVKRLVDPGDLATTGIPLINLEAVSPIIFETSIPAHWVSKIHKDQQVNIKLYNTSFETVATVRQMINSADPITQKCTVKLSLPPSLNVPTGLFGQAQFIIDKEPLLTIPEKALIDRVGISGVFLLDEQNRVWFMPVRYGRKYNNKRVILAGLEPDDKVVLSPSRKLRDGVPIIQANK